MDKISWDIFQSLSLVACVEITESFFPPSCRVTIEHARARSRGGRGRGRYSDRFSSRRPRNDRRYVIDGGWLL